MCNLKKLHKYVLSVSYSYIFNIFKKYLRKKCYNYNAK